MSLKDTIRMEACSNNRQVYDKMCVAPHPYFTVGSQSNQGLGSRDRPRRWESESTRFHGPNVASCEIVKVPDIEAGSGVATLRFGFGGGIGFGVGSSNAPRWG